MIRSSSLLATLDRNANALLAAASGFMVLMFASFLLVLVQASTASAEEGQKAVCGGKDLIAYYEENEPEKLEKLRADAAATLNGSGIFWKIEKDGIAPSYLLGTMHMADERIASLSKSKTAALDAVDTIIVENIESLDPAQASNAMLQHKDMTLYTDGTTLADRVEPETLEKLRAATQARGVPFAVAQIMKPWLVATTVALPVCELNAKQAGKPVLDTVIAMGAKDAGKTLVGLETISEQFSAMHDLPESFHLEALRETLNMGSLAEDMIETMKIHYLKGEIGIIQPLTKIVSPKTSSSKDFEEFNTRLITDRNKVMAERSLPYLEKGNVFVAVGALHLVGETGLVNAYQQAGYKVTPIAK